MKAKVPGMILIISLIAGITLTVFATSYHQNPTPSVISVSSNVTVTEFNGYTLTWRWHDLGHWATYKLERVEGNGLLAIYEYDAFGNRVSKIVNGQITRFYYVEFYERFYLVREISPHAELEFVHKIYQGRAGTPFKILTSVIINGVTFDYYMQYDIILGLQNEYGTGWTMNAFGDFLDRATNTFVPRPTRDTVTLFTNFAEYGNNELEAIRVVGDLYRLLSTYPSFYAGSFHNPADGSLVINIVRNYSDLFTTGNPVYELATRNNVTINIVDFSYSELFDMLDYLDSVLIDNPRGLDIVTQISGWGMPTDGNRVVVRFAYNLYENIEIFRQQIVDSSMIIFEHSPFSNILAGLYRFDEEMDEFIPVL